MKNKAGYTATLVACGTAGGQEQCWRRSLEHLCRSSRLKKLKNAEKVTWSAVTDALLGVIAKGVE